jgi:hypothetical protein
MSNDNIRELLVDAANRSANYVEKLRVREVRAERAAMRISVSSWATTAADAEHSIDAILEAHRAV